jgi:nucleotide-binding universal stress UspA family protein
MRSRPESGGKMFEKILVPTDFSKHSQKVLECLGDLPGLKEIVLLNVVARDPLARVWDPVAEAKQAEEKVKEEAKNIKLPGVTIKARALSALEGETPSVINMIADQENVGLVMMGARGRSIIQSAILGSTSRNVLRFGDRNLLIMRYKLLDALEDAAYEKYCSHVFSKVLLPTDFSQPAEAAISFVKSVPGLGEIALLHVVSKGETQAEMDVNVSSATDKLNEIVQELSKGGIKAKPVVVTGHSVEEIRAMADKEDASLIAMSSHGETSSKTERIGSTAYDVANSSNRPVLIIRSRKPISA